MKDWLKRLYACRHTSLEMQHEKQRVTEEGFLRYPSNEKTWKNLDNTYSEFIAEPSNVQLGLATDGFNSFGKMNLAYSRWPVVLTAYNLLPWLCMKSEYLMLTLLIPGPKSSWKHIDVFLQPLVEEPKMLITDVRLRDETDYISLLIVDRTPVDDQWLFGTRQLTGMEWTRVLRALRALKHTSIAH